MNAGPVETARRRPGAGAGPWLALGLLAAPVAVGVAYAGLGATRVVGPGAAGFTLEAVVAVLAEPGVWRGVGWSVWVALASTGVSTVVAVALAVALRGDDGGARWSSWLILVPLPVPHLVAAVCGVLVLGQSGLLGRLATLTGWVSAPAQMPALVWDGWGVGLIVALVWKEVPFLFLIAGAVLATGGQAAEAEARRLGASPGQVLRWVTLPLLWRGMLPGVVAVFAFVLGSWEAAALLAPSAPLALPLQIWEAYTDAALARRAHAYALTLLALLLALAAVGLHDRARAAGGPGGGLAQGEP
jgi:putative spermidine/putrescine transport system permease protein